MNVQWLHCGHNILQERKSAVAQLVLKLVAQAHNEKPEVSMDNLDKLANKVVEEEVRNCEERSDELGMR